MAIRRKLRKWHFLVLGTSLILVAIFLWYWNWRRIGLPLPIQPEHFITIVTYITGVFVLGVFIYRLNRKQVLIMLVGMVIVNLLAALGTLWAYRSFPTIFDILCPLDVSETTDAYLSDWKAYFLTPAIYAAHAGLLVLWIENLVMFLIRKPTDEPE
jgi:hypothetical protein